VPAFVIFHDTTLAAIAEARPASRDALLALPGLGPVKAERYGDQLLAVVATASSSST
jgi:superfamily II DNA helicase RecQ